MWLARDTVLGNPHVAIKFLTAVNPEKDKEFLLENIGNEVWFHDLHSTVGTWVYGILVRGKQPLMGVHDVKLAIRRCACGHARIGLYENGPPPNFLSKISL